MTVRLRKRKQTTIESHEVWIIRGAGRRSNAWCEACAGQTGMLTPEEVARLRSVSPRP